MKKITYITLLFATILFASCEKYKVEYDQAPQVEFKPITVTLAKGTTTTPGRTTVLVQLIGPHQSSDISVPYTIDAASTAVAGTHFTASTTGTVTIPAGSSTGSIVITAMPENVPSARRLILVLSDGGTLPVSPNYRRSTITIQ
ncbi:MAG: hypothetical protein EOO90_04520 [Pedobacter sp.]|nr:MAG: hypothetical protein EOO90_04520 [Pedobacter sp.]